MGTMSGIWSNMIIPQLLAKAIIIFCCFPVHECAHAWMAEKLGDPTGAREGRVTLNPIRHLDLWGTIMLIAFGVGHAKPVPVNTYNFQKPRKDHAIVSLAGPMSNLIMATAFLLIGHLIHLTAGAGIGYGDIIGFIVYCLRYAAYINFGLTVLNLIPIPPMDGYHVLIALVPYRFSHRVARLERYSVYALLGLLLVFSFFRISPISAAAQSMYDSVDSLYGFVFHS